MATSIDKAKFKEALASADTSECKNLNHLWDKTAAIYKQNTGQEISRSLVYQRVREWKLKYNTESKKGRGPGVEVDIPLLKTCITESEKDGPLSNRTELYHLVAEKYNAKKPDATITHSIVYLRIDANEIDIKTPKGKRGGDGSQLRGSRIPGVRRSRADKFNASPEAKKSFERLEKSTPTRFLPLVDAIKRGSRSAAVKLHCIECSGYSTAEVRNCACPQCPLYLFRPYQGKPEPEEEGEAVTAEDDANTEETVEV